MMTNNDWLDEIFAGWNCFYKADKIVDFDSKTLKQQILDHISNNYVTKQECEKRVLVGKKEIVSHLMHRLRYNKYATGYIAETLKDEYLTIEQQLKELEKL